MPTFSERHGLETEAPPIRYREKASANLREMLIGLAEKHGLEPSRIRAELCELLFVAPDTDNWSEYPNIDNECRYIIKTCAWHEVYDAIEALGQALYGSGFVTDRFEAFQKDINRLLVKEGAAWQMVDGLVVARGSEPFNVMTADAQRTLDETGNSTAASEIHEAIKNISRRPTPDKTGAVHHAMGALECMARSMSSDPKSTLGEVLKKGKTHGIPPPLDEAVSKMWGYSSERGRHIREGDEPSFEEAELIVTVAAAICIYLSKKAP